MSSYEEDLQKNLEAGDTASGDELDIQSYQKVFQALPKQTGFNLNPSFADTVVNLMVKRQGEKSNLWEYFWLGVGIFALLTAFIITVALIGFRFDLGFLKGMSNFGGLFIFGVAFIAGLHWLDKRLIRNKQSFSA